MVYRENYSQRDAVYDAAVFGYIWGCEEDTEITGELTGARIYFAVAYALSDNPADH